MRGWRWLVVSLVLILLIVGVFASGYWLGNRRVAHAEADTGFDVLWTVRAILDRSFIGEIPSAQQQAYGAAHGLVAAFNDPYTLFVEPAPREMERDELAGHFGGIGAYMTRNDADDLVLTIDTGSAGGQGRRSRWRCSPGGGRQADHPGDECR